MCEMMISDYSDIDMLIKDYHNDDVNLGILSHNKEVILGKSLVMT